MCLPCGCGDDDERFFMMLCPAACVMNKIEILFLDIA
jgi:hypothetical protein